MFLVNIFHSLSVVATEIVAVHDSGLLSVVVSRTKFCNNVRMSFAVPPGVAAAMMRS